MMTAVIVMCSVPNLDLCEQDLVTSVMMGSVRNDDRCKRDVFGT